MNKILAIVLLLVCAFTAIFPVSVVAEATEKDCLTVSEIKSTSVMKDLAGLSIHGKEFDAADYPARDDGNLQVLTLAEFNFSEDKKIADEYVVCVYVYNPQKLNLVSSSSLNAIELATGFEKTDDDLKTNKFSKFRLDFCNKSDDGLFYKFAIKDTYDLLFQSMKSCSQISGGVRRYYVSGIELLSDGADNAVDYIVGWHWDYAGYAQTLAGGASTLTMSEGNSEYISTEMKSTYFQPEGAKVEQGAVFSRINSVYFGVPNSFLEKYGEMTAVHFSAWIYDTSPIYVLNKNNKLAKAAYDYLQQYIGKEIEAPDKSAKYQLYAYNPLTEKLGSGHKYYWVYNDDYVQGAEIYDKQSSLYWFFASDSADKFVLSGDDVKNYALGYLSNYNAPYDEEEFEKRKLANWKWLNLYYGVEDETALQAVNNYFRTTDYMIAGKYPSWLFTMPNPSTTLCGLNDFTVSVNDEKIDLTSIIRSKKSFWSRGFDKYEDLSAEYQDINLIVQVDPNDLELSQADFCKKYLIAEQDVEVFKNYVVERTQEDKTVFLIRHTVSDYTAYGLFTDEYATPTGFKENEGSCAFQETVFLDMDLIDLTFTRDEVNTVIPCVSTPIDVFDDLERHPEQKLPDDGLPTWATVLIIVAIVLVVMIVLSIFVPFLGPIFKVLVQILLLPLKLLLWLLKAVGKGIGALFKKIGQAISNRKRK